MKEKAGMIVSVGAGPMQYEFIRRLKEKGYTVAAFGRGKNAEEAILLCDYFKEIDTSDSEEAIGWLETLGVPVLAVGSYAGGVAIKTLQALSSYFNLVTAIPENLIIGMNKLEQQQMYEQYDLSTISTYSRKDLLANKELLNKSEEYIWKPAVGRGSSGVKIIKGEELIDRLLANDMDENDMVQTIVRGKEYRMLIIVQDGQIRLLAPIQRKSFKNTFFLGRLKVSFQDYQAVLKHAEKIVKNLGIQNSVIKYDIMVDNTSVNLIEMDIGVGGGFYFKKYISCITGVDIMDVYIDLICGKEMPEIVCKKNNMIMDYIYNENLYPVEYDISVCEEEIGRICGWAILIPNQLHPEKKGFYTSNADFLFTVIHEKTDISQEELNRFVNERLLKRREKEN